MFKELKMQSLKKNLFVIIVFMFFGCLAIGTLWSAIRALLGGKQDLDELTADQIHDGMYVEGTVWGIYDGYAGTSEESNGRSKIISQEYIIPVGEAEYMGMVVTPEYFDQCDALLEETYEYLIGESDVITGQFRVKGTILSMDNESKRYFREALGYDDWSLEDRELALSYYLVVDQVGSEKMSTTLIFAAIGLVMWGVTLWVLISALSGRYQKDLKKYCAESGAQAKVEQFYRSTTPIHGMRISRDYILGAGAKTNFLLADNLLWAYTYVHETKRYGLFTVSKTVSVKLTPKEGKQEDYRVKNEDQAGEILEQIRKVLPWVIVGYSDELAKAYKIDRESMARAVEERKAQEGGLL